MRNKSLSRLQYCLVCLFLTIATVFFAACDNGNFMEWPSYTVVFHPNGGSGNMEDSIRRHGTAQNLAENAFYKEGYSFAGWARSYCSDEVEFTDQQNVINLARADGASIRLYAIWRVHSFTVVYNANGGDGIMENSVFRLNDGNRNLRPNTFTNDPNVFLGWARSHSGHVEFRDGESVKELDVMDGDIITLYAMWGSGTFTVTFNANGGTGTPPSPQVVEAGGYIRLPSGIELSKSNHIFGGWNTSDDGTGTNFDVDTTFTPMGDTALYAKWNIGGNVLHTVTFDANGGFGAVPAPKLVEEGYAITLPDGYGLLKSGFDFIGWNTSADGTGDNLDLGTEFTPIGDITLYAGWLAVFIVKFDTNGGSGVPPSPQMAGAGSYIRLPGAGELLRTGFDFAGWNTSACGTGDNFNAGAHFIPVGNITLYARWLAIFTVTFNANNGSGTPPAPLTVNEGSTVTLPGAGDLSKTGHTFDGWNTMPDGTGTNFSAGAVFTPTRSITLYARWDNSIIVPGYNLAARLAWLQINAQTGGNYLIEVTEDESIIPHMLSYSGRTNVTLSLTGVGSRRTIVPLVNGSLFTVGSGVTLVLGSNLTLNGKPANNAPLVQVNNGSTFVMNPGARITGNINIPTWASVHGGGVRVNSGGSFTMYGGDIWGNASSAGAGVNVAAGGTFTMRGGTISDNNASGNGGGVRNDGTFRMSDGIIHGGNAAPGLGNTANSGAALSNGGTAWLGTFGGGEFVQVGTFYTSTDLSVHAANGVLQGREGSLAAQLVWLRDFAQSGGRYNIEIAGDETLVPQTLPVGRNNLTITLMGNGGMRVVGLSQNGTLFEIGSGVSLELGSNIILQGRPANNTHLVRVNNGGGLIMNTTSRIADNVNTSGLFAANHGGGVRVNNGGTFVMNGGDIWGNASNPGTGGGVHVANGGTFDMRGGTISDNTAGGNGGGVHNAGTFRMSHGLIHGYNADPGLGNMAGNGIALFNAGSGISQHGTFTGNTFAQLGSVPTMNRSVHVTNGLLQLMGTIGLTGTAQVGQTLTANTVNLGGSGDISFQWRRGTTNVGTNSYEYVVQLADAGHRITVTATRSNNFGSITSEPTGIVPPAVTGTVRITGIAQVGQTLTANTDALGGSGDIIFQWRRGTTNVGTNSDTYLVQAADLGTVISVRVRRSGYTGELTSDPTSPVIPPTLTGTVSITGNTRVGQTLTANTTGLDGSGALSFQWRRGTTDIGTDSPMYVVQAADIGLAITVTVTRADRHGSITSAPTDIITNHVEDFTIGFADFLDVETDITGPTIRLVGSLAETSRNVTLINPSQYDTGSIRWFIGWAEITGGSVSGSHGETLSLDSRIHNNRTGIHFVTVEVSKGGVQFSTVIYFTVIP